MAEAGAKGEIDTSGADQKRRGTGQPGSQSPGQKGTLTVEVDDVEALPAHESEEAPDTQGAQLKALSQGQENGS